MIRVSACLRFVHMYKCVHVYVSNYVHFGWYDDDNMPKHV